MSKNRYTVQVVVEVDSENIGVDRVKRNVKCAIKNALDHVEGQGFLHPDAHDMEIHTIEVKVE